MGRNPFLLSLRDGSDASDRNRVKFHKTKGYDKEQNEEAINTNLVLIEEKLEDF